MLTGPIQAASVKTETRAARACGSAAFQKARVGSAADIVTERA